MTWLPTNQASAALFLHRNTLTSTDEKVCSRLERTRQATREREKAIHQEQLKRQREWSEMLLLQRMAANPVSEVAAAQAREQWGITGH